MPKQNYGGHVMKKSFTYLFTFLVFFIGLTATVASQVDLSDGLLGYWPLDEGTGTTTADKSDVKSNGTIHGGAAWAEGFFGEALEFDGVDDYVDVDNDVYEFGPADFTISAWIKSPGHAPAPGGTSADMTIFGKGGDDGGGIRYHLTVPGSTITFLLDGDDDAGGKGKYDPNGDIVVLDSTWHHIVAYRSELTLRVFVDGVEDMGVTNHAESDLPADYVIAPTVHPAFIGAITSNNDGFPINKFWYGIIDDVAIWERVLEADEIEYLWNDGAGNPVLIDNTSVSGLNGGKNTLLNNYPNPFSTLTTFDFQLRESSHIKLTIFNALGQEVASVVDGVRSAGSYSEQFDASALSEGVYFAKLQTGLNAETIKMIVKR
jgi:hypothetical protein